MEVKNREAILETKKVKVILCKNVRKRIGLFVEEFWVIPPTQIEGGGIGIILCSIIKVVKGICLFHGEILD